MWKAESPPHRKTTWLTVTKLQRWTSPRIYPYAYSTTIPVTSFPLQTSNSNKSVWTWLWLYRQRCYHHLQSAAHTHVQFPPYCCQRERRHWSTALSPPAQPYSPQSPTSVPGSVHISLIVLESRLKLSLVFDHPYSPVHGSQNKSSKTIKPK